MHSILITKGKRYIKQKCSDFLCGTKLVQDGLNVPVKNINLDYTRKQKKVLVCYLNYLKSSNMLDGIQGHVHDQHFFQMIKVLIDHDYAIDTCPERARGQVDFTKYDFILGEGSVVMSACKANVSAMTIAFMTGQGNGILKEAEERRADYFKERHGFYPKVLRGRALEDIFFLTDAIIYFGESWPYEALNKPKFHLNINAFFNESFDPKTIDTGVKDPHKFILYGTSNSWILKGVDLLFEVFERHPEYTLYMCGPNLRQEASALGYRKFPDNIVDCGFVDYRSDRFIELFSECSYILLPSASEGQSSAVATGMAHGLIPIVSRGTGWDEYAVYCKFFPGYLLEDIEKTIVMAANKPLEEIEKQSLDVYKFARDEFSLTSFSKSFDQFVQWMDKQ